MIDFRFHLVSIVSIFLALAVGIVLGAGPLQGSIGTQLTDQVAQLRQEKDTLRSQLDDATKSVDAQQDYAARVAGAALAGRLVTSDIVLVVGTDTAGKFSDEVRQALRQAGATVTTVVTLKDEFRDPATAVDRLTAGRKAAELVGVTPTDDADTLLADVVSRVLVHAPGTNGAPLPDAVEALGALKSAGFLDWSQSDLQRASEVVVLAGPYGGTSASVASQTAPLMALTTALNAASSGVVVASGAPTTGVGQDVTTNLVTQVRADKQAAAAISTVDHADSTIGAGLVVLAAVRELSGVSGHYGISPDAQTTVPPAS
ncbi:MAG: copper transporter [Lapillicoccus sp.]